MMRRVGFEPTKALSHEISYESRYYLSLRKDDILSLAHLTALEPPHVNQNVGRKYYKFN